MTTVFGGGMAIHGHLQLYHMVRHRQNEKEINMVSYSIVKTASVNKIYTKCPLIKEEIQSRRSLSERNVCEARQWGGGKGSALRVDQMSMGLGY